MTMRWVDRGHWTFFLVESISCYIPKSSISYHILISFVQVYVSSQKYRHQDANLKDAIEKLGHMVRKSAIVPKVRK